MLTTLNRSAHDTGLDDGSVQCIITSPPYWGLRAYAGEQNVEWPTVKYAPMPGLPPVVIDAMTCPLGHEPTPEAYIGHMMLVMREMWRVLREDGVMWCNLGDSYANGDTGALKPKDLVGIPWRFAFAAQADGWYLRSDVIWSKPNPMPESVRDRPTKAHEYVFMLAKSQRYYWDQEAVREENSETSHTGGQYVNEWKYAAIRDTTKSGMRIGVPIPRNGRNRRTVWTIATRPYPAAHYAVFPPDLVEPMVLSSTSERGCCPQCGAPWGRVVERVDTGQRQKLGSNWDTGPGGHGAYHRNGRETNPANQPVFGSTTIGWQPTCDCPAHEPIPCTVLDPFAGSGTTGAVAIEHGRRAILVDISQEYLDEHVPERTNVQMRLV